MTIDKTFFNPEIDQNRLAESNNYEDDQKNFDKSKTRKRIIQIAAGIVSTGIFLGLTIANVSGDEDYGEKAEKQFLERVENNDNDVRIIDEYRDYGAGTKILATPYKDSEVVEEVGQDQKLSISGLRLTESEDGKDLYLSFKGSAIVGIVDDQSSTLYVKIGTRQHQNEDWIITNQPINSQVLDDPADNTGILQPAGA